MTSNPETCDGGCGCGSVRYRIEPEPLIVHACHCRWCQRQTGTAFALNALIEASRVTLLSGEVESIDTPSPSGRGQTIVRCPTCKVAVWSHYFMGGLKERVCFIRVGTLDNPDRLPPDVHIFTSTKQPWVILPADDYAVKEFYDIKTTWRRDSLTRRTALEEAMVAEGG
jgi:hypothetical protein